MVALETLRTFEELRDPAALKVGKASARPNEVKLAKTLIEQMAEDEWDPTSEPDRYEKTLRKLLASRPTVEVAAEGKKAADQEKVVDLMDALRKSLEAPRRRRTRRRRAA